MNDTITIGSDRQMLAALRAHRALLEEAFMNTTMGTTMGSGLRYELDVTHQLLTLVMRRLRAAQ